jgi:chemotaxis protein methyltransferase CheR
VTVSVSQSTLVLFNRFIARSMGLHLKDDRLNELAQKVVAISTDFGYEDPEECLLWLMSGPLSREQADILARSLTIGETYFLRDPQSFQVLEKHVLPELIKTRRAGEKSLRIWSAGCSTGEEPYSIAILLSRILPDPDDWNIMLLATDINPVALERGRQGIYGKWSFRNAPPWLMDYFRKRKDGRLEIIPAIRQMVRFSYLNLAEDSYPSLLNSTNAIDIIFCRNVMLYFGPELIEKMIGKFHHALQDGGWLFVSPTEVSCRPLDGFTCKRFPGAFAYRKGGGDGAGREELWIAAHEPRTAAVAVMYPQALHEPPTAFAPAVELSEPATKGSSRDGYLEAVALYDEGSYESAAVKVREMLAAGDGNADALELLAKSYANLGKLADARQCCEEAINADKLRAHNHYLLSIILEEQGELEEAAAALKRVLYIDHDFVLAHFALGNMNRQAGKKKEAERNFGNALRILEKREPCEVLRDAEGMTAGRLAEIIRVMV